MWQVIIVKRLTNLAFKYKIYPMFMFVISTLLAITVVVQNIAIAEILNAMLLETNQNLLILLLFTLFILIARATFNTINQMIGNRMSTKVKYDLRRQLIFKQSKEPIGVQMNTLTESIDGIVPFFNSYFPQVFKSMMIPLFIIVSSLLCIYRCQIAIFNIYTSISIFNSIFSMCNRNNSCIHKLLCNYILYNIFCFHI